MMVAFTIPQTLLEEARELCGTDEMAAQALAASASYFELRPDDVLGPTRHQEVVWARKAWMCVLHEEGYGGSEIGVLARRDHSTVQHDVLWAKRDIAAATDGMDEATRFVTAVLERASPRDDGGLVHAAAEHAGVAAEALLGDAPKGNPKLMRLQRLVFYLLKTERGFTPLRAADLLGVSDLGRLRCRPGASNPPRSRRQLLLEDLRSRAVDAPRLDASGRASAAAGRTRWPAQLRWTGRKVLPGSPAPADRLAYEALWHKSDMRHLREAWRYPDLSYG